MTSPHEQIIEVYEARAASTRSFARYLDQKLAEMVAVHRQHSREAAPLERLRERHERALQGLGCALHKASMVRRFQAGKRGQALLRWREGEVAVARTQLAICWEQLRRAEAQHQPMARAA